MTRRTVLSTKLTEAEAVRVEVAARLTGLTKSELARAAVLDRTTQELRKTRPRPAKER